MFVVFAVFGMLYFFLIASVAYYVYFHRFRARFHPDYELDRVEMKSAVKWSIIGIVGNAVLMLPIHVLIACIEMPASLGRLVLDQSTIR